RCRFGRAKCVRYLEKFSGPLLDRFGILMYSQLKQERKTSGEQILKRINNYFEIQNQLDEQKFEVKFPATLLAYYSNASMRRKNYLEKVAQIYAVEGAATSKDCDKNQLNIEIDHLHQAEKWVLKPFELLEKGMG
ncbi:MAG: hypothetical protein ACXVAX_10855, partial [Pseudobdellovibrio sp.]